MELHARDKELRAALDSEGECKRWYGAEMTKKLRLRLVALQAAESLADFWPPKSGPERCHELIGDRRGIFSMNVKQPYRLLFRPVGADEHEPSPDERRRWMSITEIELLAIEDTHG